MTDYLVFRNHFDRPSNGQLYFAVIRLRLWLSDEYNGKEEKRDSDKKLLAHLAIPHIVWNEAWWRRLRELSKTPLFRSVRRYI